MRVHFACSVRSNSVEVATSAHQGPYQPWFKNLQVTVYGLANKAASVEVDGKPVTTWKEEAGAVTASEVPWAARAHTIRLNLITGAAK
jgi:hypothetical protein